MINPSHISWIAASSAPLTDCRPPAKRYCDHLSVARVEVADHLEPSAKKRGSDRQLTKDDASDEDEQVCFLG
jgi:hypothetical protein